MIAIKVLNYVHGKVTDMDNMNNHRECNIDITTYPYYCSDHDVALYDERLSELDYEQTITTEDILEVLLEAKDKNERSI